MCVKLVNKRAVDKQAIKLERTCFKFVKCLDKSFLPTVAIPGQSESMAHDGYDCRPFFFLRRRKKQHLQQRIKQHAVNILLSDWQSELKGNITAAQMQACLYPCLKWLYPSLTSINLQHEQY